MRVIIVFLIVIGFLFVGISNVDRIMKYIDLKNTLEKGGSVFIDRRWVINVFDDGTISGYDGDRLVGIESVRIDGAENIHDYYKDKIIRVLIVEERYGKK